MAPALPNPILALLGGYGLAAAGSTGIACYALLTRRDEPTGRAFAALALAVGLWSAGSIGWVLAPGTDGKLAWNLLRYAGVVSVPVTWLCFTLSFTGRRRWVTRRFVAAASVVPVGVLLALATNHYHFQFYADVRSAAVAGWPMLDVPAGPLFWIHTAYAYGLFGTGTGLVVHHAFRAPQPFRRQARGLVVAGLLGWLVNVAFLAGVSPDPLVDLTPIAFAVGAFVVAGAVFRVRFLDLVPVAREVVLDRLDDAVVVVDGRGRVVDANAAAGAFLEDEAGALGEPAREVLPPAVGAVLADDDPEAERDVQLEVDGEPRWFLVRAFRVGETASRGRIVVLTDVTEGRRRRRQLERKTERLEAMAELVSHDLRTPLDVGATRLDLLADDLEPSSRETVRDHLDALETSLARAAEIGDELLEMTREGATPDRTRTVDVRTVAREAWEAVGRADLTLAVRGSRTVEADEGRLRHLLENCLRNAVEHADADAVRVGATDTGFYVEDDGRGIPADRRERVFERGYTTADGNSGRGLAIVAEVAAEHGWAVEATEGTDGGARIEVHTSVE